ncbi:MAG: MraY family glycosyltransferase [Gemmatimonadaceae bacterium]
MTSSIALAFGIALLIAFVTSVVVTPLLIRAAARWKLQDRATGARHVHTEPVPRLGGVAIYLATTLAVLAVVLVAPGVLRPAYARVLAGLLLGGTVIFATGLVDDLRGLKPVVKLGAQCGVAVAACLLGLRIQVLTLWPGVDVTLGALSIPVTVLWIVGVTNAFNLVDGLDGLATGIALVVLSTVFIAASILGNADVTIVCMALIGALAGFFRYNRAPARMFLGDSGSLFVGFLLAVLSVHGAIKSTTAVLMAIPLFALAIPLLDVIVAILRRWLRGVPIFGADARHIHHRLLAVGLTPVNASRLLCVAAAAFALLGLTLAFAPPWATLGIALVGGGGSLLLVVLGLGRLQYLEFREAGSALLSGFRRTRRAIRDQIHAREIAELVRHARTLEEVNAVLADSAEDFGFLRMEAGSERSLSTATASKAGTSSPRIWKLDYPLTPEADAGGDPYVFRILCDPERSYRPFGAERVAHILAPTVEEWLGREHARPPAADPNDRGSLGAARRDGAGNTFSSSGPLLNS